VRQCELKVSLRVAAQLRDRKHSFLLERASPGIEHFYPLHMLSNLFIVGPCVGNDCPSQRARYPDAKFQSPPAVLSHLLDQIGPGHSGIDDGKSRPPMLLFQAIGLRSHACHNPTHALIRKQDIAAVANHKQRYAGLGAEGDQSLYLFV
jgi:hypothetical protein